MLWAQDENLSSKRRLFMVDARQTWSWIPPGHSTERATPSRAPGGPVNPLAGPTRAWSGNFRLRFCFHSFGYGPERFMVPSFLINSSDSPSVTDHSVASSDATAVPSRFQWEHGYREFLEYRPVVQTTSIVPPASASRRLHVCHVSELLSFLFEQCLDSTKSSEFRISACLRTSIRR